MQLVEERESEVDLQRHRQGDGQWAIRRRKKKGVTLMFFSNLMLFASIIVALALTPGPDVIYIMTRGMAQGRTAALLSTVGICVGYLVYTTLATQPRFASVLSFLTGSVLIGLGARLFFLERS